MDKVYKKELVERVTNKLVENKAFKTTYARKDSFFVSDKEGNVAEFVVRRPGSKLQFVREDVDNMLVALMDVVEEALRNGEAIYLHHFATLYPHYRQPRSAIHPATKKRVPVPGVWVPKLDAFGRLRTATKLYQLSLENSSKFDDIDISEFEDIEDEVYEEEGETDGT